MMGGGNTHLNHAQQSNSVSRVKVHTFEVRRFIYDVLKTDCARYSKFTYISVPFKQLTTFSHFSSKNFTPGYFMYNLYHLSGSIQINLYTM